MFEKKLCKGKDWETFENIIEISVAVKRADKKALNMNRDVLNTLTFKSYREQSKKKVTSNLDQETTLIKCVRNPAKLGQFVSEKRKQCRSEHFQEWKVLQLT